MSLPLWRRWRGAMDGRPLRRRRRGATGGPSPSAHGGEPGEDRVLAPTEGNKGRARLSNYWRGCSSGEGGGQGHWRGWERTTR
jgi:hypothetical protein